MTTFEPGTPLDLGSMISGIERLVSCESPSDDLPSLVRSADLVAELGRSLLGVAAERIELDGRPHLRWRFGPGPSRLLMLGHHDTVWPVGTLRDLPFAVEDGLLRGPGCFDMKAGIVIALHALHRVGVRDGVTLLITADEELGSPTSRSLIEQEAVGCAAALILEAAAEGGALKTRRKGVSIYRLAIDGRAAHAGLEPEVGANAAVELAHQILAVAALTDLEAGTTVTPTVAAAGSATNTVPARASLSVDVRAWSGVEQRRVDERMHGLTAVVPGTSIDVSGGVNRLPLEAAASAGLFARAGRLAERLGLAPLPAAAVGGGSDGNLTAGVGVPTLDGLGAVGGGAHARHEHVVVSELPGRVLLLAALIDELLEEQRSLPTKPRHGIGVSRP